VLALAFAASLAAQAGDWSAAISRIHAGALEGHVYFLASDLLEGRDTPSRGLDIAAEYIGAQFRAAGLEPGGDDGYFQTALMERVSPNPSRFQFIWRESGVFPPEAGRLPLPRRAPVRLRNVVGILRGADPKLSGSCVVLSAHYDHVGVRGSGSGDRVYNGANDNASGSAALIEIARALGANPVRPRRSIVFIAFFGEEKGMLGSKYYIRQPVFPLASTVANLNLEHMGRSDDNDGIQRSRLSLTGMDYSSIGKIFESAGQETGVEVFRNDRYNDLLYANSDNLTFAEAGIPSHTIVAAYMFPDYHRVTDHWDKLDYPNMEKVSRTVALGLIRIADSETAPCWDSSNSRVSSYVEAAEKLKDPAHSGN
jgi:hypothetical protein